MTTNLALVESDNLIEELFSRFDHAGFIGQRTTGEDDLQERIEMKGHERVVQGLCSSLQIRCEASIVQRTGGPLY